MKNPKNFFPPITDIVRLISESPKKYVPPEENGVVEYGIATTLEISNLLWEEGDKYESMLYEFINSYYESNICYTYAIRKKDNFWFTEEADRVRPWHQLYLPSWDDYLSKVRFGGFI